MNPQVTPVPMPLSRLLAGITEVPPQLDVEVSGVDVDSRRILPGAAFMACASHDQSRHGLDFLDDRLVRDVAAVLWEPMGGRAAPDLGLPMLPVANLHQHVSELASRSLADPGAGMFVVGVTGTDGKTSVAHLLAQAAELLGERSAYMGTLGYGDLNALNIASHTTPDAVAVQQWLASFRDQGVNTVAMEVSSHALDQRRADAARFNVALLTNLNRDHLDYHPDLQAYHAAKRRLFELPGLDAVVLNQDDPIGSEWIAELAGREVDLVSYGVGNEPHAMAAHWVLGSVQAHSGGLRLDIHSSWGDGAISSGLLGDFNAWNLLAVLAVLLQRGTPFDKALAAVEKLMPVPGRMEKIAGDGVAVVVDYAHTPKALESALATLRHHSKGRLWCVFGCGGDRDRGKRPLMAAAAERLADHVILTDDNPRSEPPTQIIAEIQAGFEREGAVTVIHDRREAIRHVLDQAAANDVVLIAGKGHEDYQLVGAQRLDFDDRKIAAELLNRGAAC